MFRKVRRVNVRKRNDSEEEEREHDAPMAVEQPEHVTAEPPPISGLFLHDGLQGNKPRKAAAAAAKEPVPGITKPVKLLSFQDDEDEEEVFKVKKSNYSKKIAKLLKKEYKDDLEKVGPRSDVNFGLDAADQQFGRNAVSKDNNQEEATAGSDLGEAEMEVESEKEDEKPKAGSFANSLSSLNVLRPGEIPDAAFIHAARKKRQMARELGDVPSIDLDGGKGRLVREDENDASDDDDDDEKRRIVFSVREKSQRQKIAEEIGIEGSDDEALATGEQDEEISRWEQEQIRKGISIPQVQAPPHPEANNLFYPTTYQGIPYGSAYNMPYTYAAYGAAETKSQKADNSVTYKTPSNEMTPVTIDLVKKQLKDRLIAMEDVHKANLELYEKHEKSQEDSTNSIVRLEGCSGGNGERYQFLQEMRGYVQDLLECFREKVPLINELESAMHQLYKQRATRLVQRRQDDIKDESSEFSSHSSKALMAPNLDTFGRDRAAYQEHAKQRRIAEREARRARRRQAREVSGKMAEHLEGLSSDDEETSTDITNFNMEKDRILKESSNVFEDALENFHSIDCIRFQFESWRSSYYNTYKDAYIGLCLPKLLNPLIRLQLLSWNPLEPKCRDFEGMSWFESLLFYGCEEKEYDKEDADILLLPSLVEKVILPKLAVIAENLWDPFSTTQTNRLAAVFQKLINGYPTVVNSDNKNTEALLKALLTRMRRTLDDDVFMPLFPKHVIENKNSAPCVFFQRQFWSSVKLLGNFLKWYGVLSNKCLQELAIDGLLNRYVLMAFQNTENGEDSIKKAQSVIACFPKQWFSGIKGGKTIPQLENLARYLTHLAGVIYRQNIGCSDMEKRNARDQIRQIVKLLARIHALENAVSVVNDYNVKDVKAPSDGK
ncbi:PAX3- and PAX7-binding protein 1 isoform X1 [Bufo bufo]|uniref:PAX3- and PAX7-binding protein 1 isoform X1 n=1 Tax=Bufo bufo TaxID=8384 RepID=UPI001ABDAE56|nr:PAX3- and PAX7-binding protein 1 isoform X1 [Bufo bufo]